MSQDEANYYQQRAEAELKLAQSARHQRVVQAHYDLANYYLERLHGGVPSKPPGLIGT